MSKLLKCKVYISQVFHTALLFYFVQKPVQMRHLLNFNILVLDHIKFKNVILNICTENWK